MAPGNGNRKFVVHMYESEYRQIQAWVAKHQNLETGGDLFGLWAYDHTAVVQLVLGPGKNCRRSSVSFYQDIEYLEKVGNILTAEKGLCHIGEWHSHHRIGLTRPSGGDENTVWTNMDRYGINRFFLFIATIGSSYYDVNIGCFLFENDVSRNRRKPVLKGDIQVIVKEESPFRQIIQKQIAEGAESQNSPRSLMKFKSKISNEKHWKTDWYDEDERFTKKIVICKEMEEPNKSDVNNKDKEETPLIQKKENPANGTESKKPSLKKVKSNEHTTEPDSKKLKLEKTYEATDQEVKDSKINCVEEKSKDVKNKSIKETPLPDVENQNKLGSSPFVTQDNSDNSNQQSTLKEENNLKPEALKSQPPASATTGQNTKANSGAKKARVQYIGGDNIQGENNEAQKKQEVSHAKESNAGQEKETSSKNVSQHNAHMIFVKPAASGEIIDAKQQHPPSPQMDRDKYDMIRDTNNEDDFKTKETQSSAATSEPEEIKTEDEAKLLSNKDPNTNKKRKTTGCRFWKRRRTPEEKKERAAKKKKKAEEKENKKKEKAAKKKKKAEEKENKKKQKPAKKKKKEEEEENKKKERAAKKKKKAEEEENSKNKKEENKKKEEEEKEKEETKIAKEAREKGKKKEPKESQGTQLETALHK